MGIAIGKVDKVTLAATPWDLGPRTKAQDKGKVVEEVMFVDPDTGRASNPNGVIRTRRQTWIGRYAVKGQLTPAQFSIAVELLDAYMGRQARDPLAALRIDPCHEQPEPEVARFDARRKFHRMWAIVPMWARPVIECVVIRDCSVRSMGGDTSSAGGERQMDRLARGLDALFDAWAISHAVRRGDGPA